MEMNQGRIIRLIIAFLNTVFILSFVAYKMLEFQDAKALVLAYEDIALPNIFINDLDVSNLNRDEIKAMIDDQIKQYKERKIIVHVGEKDFETTLSQFNPTVNQEIDQLVDEIIAIGKDLELMEQVSQIKEPMRYEFTVGYTYDHDEVEKWARMIEKEVYVEKVEPKFEMAGYGILKLNEGQDGQLILTEELRDMLIEELDISSMDPIEVEANVMTDPRERDIEQLKMINTKISSYSTDYPTGIPRAKNVELAASKINHTILMPGEQFSYAEKVSPVDGAHGYVNATIFLNGRAVPGVGGGICQVSSTLYNAQLKAGIIATERRNHSLPVSYVPLGQDATMADNAIDLKFINTLEYPIYIHTYAQYGSLTVEIWSNSEALHGITYRPKTIIYDGGLKADTTLYGYNADGEVVYEQFLHTSVYKKKAH